MNFIIGALKFLNRPSIRYIAFCVIFIMVCMSFGADGSFELDSKMTASGSTIYKWVKTIINVVCLFLSLAFIYLAVVGGNKGAWWVVAGVIVFALMANNAPEIYNAVIPGADLKIK